jgi:ADP-ribose pyrophosphatase YjhB (NUDIX family)
MTHFCYQCGTALKLKLLEGREREVCPACGWIHYEHRKVSAAVCVEQEGRLLLVQRGIEPWKGCWYMPAGYLEIDEDPRACAAREFAEETGYQASIGDLLGIYTYEDDPRGNGIVLLYLGRITGGAVKPNAEMQQVRFFSPAEARSLPKAGSGGTRQIEDWISRAGEEKV